MAEVKERLKELHQRLYDRLIFATRINYSPEMTLDLQDIKDLDEFLGSFLYDEKGE